MRALRGKAGTGGRRRMRGQQHGSLVHRLRRRTPAADTRRRLHQCRRRGALTEGPQSARAQTVPMILDCLPPRTNRKPPSSEPNAAQNPGASMASGVALALAAAPLALQPAELATRDTRLSLHKQPRRHELHGNHFWEGEMARRRPGGSGLLAGRQRPCCACLDSLPPPHVSSASSCPCMPLASSFCS